MRPIVFLALAGLLVAASACQSGPANPPMGAPSDGPALPGSAATAFPAAPTPDPTLTAPPPTATATRASLPALELTATAGLTPADIQPAEALREGRPLPAARPMTAANIDQAGLLAVWGQGIPAALGYSPDGKFLGVETAAGQYLYHAENYSRAAFNRETWLAIFPTSVARLQAREGAEWALILDGQAAGYTQPFSPLAVSSDGSLAAVVGSDGKVGIWDTTRAEKLKSFRPVLPDGPPGACRAVTGLAFSPDGSILAVGCDLGGVLLVNAGDGSLARHLPAELFNAGPLAFSQESLLAAGFSDPLENGSTVLVWDSRTGQELQRLDAPALTGGWDLTALAFSPGGGSLVSGYQSGPVLAWDLQAGSPRQILHGFAPSGSDLEFSPDGLWLANTAYSESQLRTPLDGQVVHRLVGQDRAGEPGEALSLAFSPGGQVFAASRWPGESDIWRLPGAEYIRSLAARCCYNRFDHDGARLGLLEEGGIEFYRLGSWQPGASIEALADPVEFAISPVEDWIIYGQPGELVVKDSRTGKHVHTIELAETAGQNTPGRVVYSPDGAQIAFRLGDQVIIMRSPEWEVIHTLAAADAADLAFSPDSALLAAAGESGVQVWDAISGKQLALISSPAPLDSLAFSPDGALLAAPSGKEGVILVWGVEE